MSKRAIITLVALMLSIVSTSTSALANKETDDLLQSWRMELRFTPYKPKISQNATKQAFYDLMYGDSEPVMTTFATHHYLWKGFGLLGVGASVGYWKTTGKTRLCSDADGNYIQCYGQGLDAIAASSTEGNSNTQLMIIPLSLEVAYRIDYLNREWSVPLDFYAKLGIDYHFWWATTEGEIATSTREEEDGTSNTINGSGGTPGLNGSVGVTLDLSFLEPMTATRARKNGIAASYLFFEWNWAQGDGFKQPNRLDMSSSGWTLGLGMDFL
jgi:hypothetical protein